MLLNFQARFAQIVKNGTKRQTIRANRRDGRVPKVGERLHLYTGLRTKKARCLGLRRCKSALPIIMDRQQDTHRLFVVTAGATLWGNRILHLAKRDGFSSVREFEEFFETTHGFPFIGWIIRW